MTRKKMTILALQDKKARGEPITMITACDYPGTLAADRAGLDSILVGDSLGMVVLGYDSTVPVTMDEMIHHCKAVRRGAQFAYLIGDLPFLSYQADRAEAVRNAGRFLKEAGMDAVKLEGGRADGGHGAGHHRRRHGGRGSHRAYPAVGGPVGRLPRPGQDRGRRAAAAGCAILFPKREQTGIEPQSARMKTRSGFRAILSSPLTPCRGQ